MERTERDAHIIRMYNEGKRTSHIAQYAGITPRQVQRIIRDRVGPMPKGPGKSTDYQLANLRGMIVQLLEDVGRDFTVCEQCNEDIPEGKFDLHHTKYDGAALNDIIIVCRACNLSRVNRYLS